MDTTQPCKGCGVLLPANAPDGLCQNCRTPAAGKTVLLTPDAFLPQSKTQPPPAPEIERLGGFRIIRLLGQGGMGAVYEAEEMESGRRVALKVLSRGLDSPEARRRFLREGRLAASVNHPNTVYVFGTDEIDGQPVIVMELVSSGTLQDRVKDHHPMAVEEAVDAILQVIAGLEAAAALGVLHRDVKPSNCFVEADGTVKVGDFGLSVPTAVRGETKLTMAGAFMGTPAFSSPEQLRGDEFTMQGDIYAVGVTLYYLLAGRTPFEGDDVVRMLTTILERPPESPAVVRPGLPKGLCRAVLRCLEKQPAKRFKTYARLRDALMPYSSAAATPATMSLRFLAGCIDKLIVNIAAMPLALLPTKYLEAWLRQLVSHTFTGLLTSMAGSLLNLLYYGVLEGLWGASLGKQLCRLRVVGPNRALPGVPRALLRAVILEWLPALPGVIYFWFFTPHQGSPKEFIKVGGVAGLTWIILLLLFSTARRRNGFATVQDLLTRTRVVRRSSHAARPVLERVKDKPAAPQGASQLGPYKVLETLAKIDGEEMLLAFDSRLLRNVWIRKLPAGAPPVAPSLRNLARVGRLRWLNSKRSAEECWDAYEAAPGQSLADLIRRRQPWNRVRFWLMDLAEEMNAGLKDQTLPAILQLDRVWITADGRAKLLDFPAPGSGAPAANLGGSSPQLFLNQVAVAALEGRSVQAAEAQPAKVAVPLPLHAKELLAEMQAGLNPSLLMERLKPLLGDLAFVSRRRRLGLIAGVSLLPLIACVIFYGAFAMPRSWWSSQTQASEITTLCECLRQLSELQTNRDLPGGLDGGGAAYSANLLGPGLTWNGLPFQFGPSNGPDVVTAIGQTIALPAGHFTNLALLATGVDGNQPSQVFTVNYADNKSSRWEQSFSDWLTPQQYRGESNALMMAYRNSGDGKKDDRSLYLYGYAFPLESNRTARSLTLPRNPNIEILALTLAPPVTTVHLSSDFNQANGLVADGSHFSIKSDKPTREAWEIYIAGNFREIIDNLEIFKVVDKPIPPDQLLAARQLMARRNAPTELELAQAAGVVEPNLKGEALYRPARSFNALDHPVLLFTVTNPFLYLGAIPSVLAALLRGGLVMRMLGVAVVKKDGTPASGFRMFGRSFIAWLPVLLMGPLAALVLPSAGLSTWERTLLYLGYIILTAALAMCAALLPERGLHDRLAGTCLVPRE